MNIEEFRNYCLSLPQVEEKRPFDEFTLCYYIAGKIFALADLENCTYSNLKCKLIEHSSDHIGFKVDSMKLP